MKPIFYYSNKKRILPQFVILFSLLCIQSCKPGAKKDDSIEIVTENMDFQMADEIPSGWNTFRYINKSNDTHFFLLDKYPEGKTIKDAEKEVSPPFQNGMDLITAGKPDEANAEFGKLPAWFSKVVFSGGSGLLSPNHSSVTTVNLKPGYYIIECYVKMANGKFHSTMGMSKALIVKEKDSGNLPLDPTINISISSTDGIIYDKPIDKGKQVFSVNFKDQIVHENFVGHDVNLVKLDANADTKVLEKWMNWADPKGLISPAPEGFTFLGGVNDMPAGSTGYFSVTLEPGNYAFISEVPNASSKGLLKTFTVSD